MDRFPFQLQEDEQDPEYLSWAFSTPAFSDLLSAIPDPQPPLRQSAFVEYRTFNGATLFQQQQSVGRSINRRVIGFLRRNWEATRQETFANVAEASKEFRHMMKERLRRERLSQSYADLRHILSTRSKGDKNSVVQAAAVYLKELKGVRDELEGRNEELEEMVAVGREQVKGATIKFRAMNSSSAIDSMIGALQCIRGMELEAQSMLFNFCGQELSAAVTLKTEKVAMVEVKSAMESALREAEKKSRTSSSQQGQFFVSCHVENVP